MSTQEDGGEFPSLSQQLAYFQTAFDKSEAVRAGVIVPAQGVNQGYDQALAGIERVKGELEAYLTEERRRLGIKVSL